MGVYVSKQSVTASTLPAAPIRIEVLVPEKYIIGIQAMFESGLTGMPLSVRVLESQSVIWPSKGSPDEWISGAGGAQISTHAVHVLRSAGPYRLAVEFTNSDSGGAHLAEVRIETADFLPLVYLQGLWRILAAIARVLTLSLPKPASLVLQSELVQAGVKPVNMQAAEPETPAAKPAQG